MSMNLLVVDDEIYAIRAILQGNDWNGMGFNEVFSANDADEAMDILQANRIDLMICDIEMPGTSGLELVEWMMEEYSYVETIFLTGHADFSYAQKAVHLGSFDYLLKPIKYEQLQKVALKAIDKIKRDQESQLFGEAYKKYTKLWEAQKPVLVERFWQDILAFRLLPTPENLQQSLSSANLSIESNTYVWPILISVEYWQKEFNARDEEIMEYALRNAAAELIIQSAKGDVIQDKSGSIYVLLYGEESEFPDKSQLGEACRSFIEASTHYLYCSLSCYIGLAAPINQLAQTCHQLADIEQENVNQMGSVQWMQEQRVEGTQPKKKIATIDWQDWVVLLETGKKEELLRRVKDMFNDLQQQSIDAETLESVYHSILHLLYQVAHKKGASVKVWLGSAKSDTAAATRSLPQLKAWTLRAITAAMDKIEELDDDSSAFIEKVKQYVLDHLKDVTRESIAAHVFLNAAYLSRLFKKETGQSLVDFVIHTKMNEAKIMLTESNRKISDICEALGYENFSHFGKMFKKSVGITPQEFRKRYQSIRSGLD